MVKAASKGLEPIRIRCIETRMTTFIKTKFNISDDQRNNDNIE